MRPFLLSVILLSSLFSQAQAPSKKKEEVPKILVVSHFVYVEAEDGDSFNPRVLPADRKAIADLQYALQDWKYYIVTAKRREAQLMFVVRKSNIASVQGEVGVHGGNEPRDNRTTPETDSGPGVTTGLGAKVGPVEDLFSVYILNPDGSLQGPIWRQYMKDGLDAPELPLFKQFKKTIESASKQAASKPSTP
jgi:hypothetical protein